MNLKTLINNNKNQFEKGFKNLLNKKLDNSILSKSMIYSVINGGKRLRPFLINQASKIAKISNHDAFILGASVECIHSYSLIHDDLPCMDDDDYRRGKLSTHKKFNEATAILAGDALHDLAFELLSSDLKSKNYKSQIKVINYLSSCLGHKGLALGQSLDLQFENKKINKKKILNMYQKKTGKLFEFCFASPFILATAEKKYINFAKDFGLLFGLIFQIIDDLIDQTGTFKTIGKTPGKDFKQGKGTLIKLIGRKEAIKFCNYKLNYFKTKNKEVLRCYPILNELLDIGMTRIN